MTTVALDIECYRNYFLAVMKTPDGRTFRISKHNDITTGDIKQFKGAISNHTILTFNGTNYDMPLVGAFLAGFSNLRLKQLSDNIINSGDPWWILSGQYSFRIPKCNHVDLMGVTPLIAGLKTYMARIHAPTIQDLPIHPSAIISDEDAVLLDKYCENDVDGTILIYQKLKPQLLLRVDMQKEYGLDFRSKSDPQIAEAILRKEFGDRGHPVAKRDTAVLPFRYNPQPFIKFDSPELVAINAAIACTEFTVNDTGYVKLPAHLEKPIEFGGASYKLGIGGLHSQEKKQVVLPGPDELYGEFDVASMYPSIILGQSLYPKHLGGEFCDIYKTIFDARLKAKHSGNKTVSDTLKIVLNSSYGKFGSRYSFLYSPELLVQTTLTGQLALLMLIERFTAAGLSVKSANTDGVNILMHKASWGVAEAIAAQWTTDTGYVLEWTPYTRQYSRDVNSYIAFTADGLKTKGAYEYGSISKGHSNEVCIDAVIAHLTDGTPMEHTINTCRDVSKFTTMRGVRGGGKWRGTDLGKVVRWYLSTDGEPIRYIKNDNKVATSSGAKPMMVLPKKLPDDIDYPAYLAAAKKLLKNLGVN